MANINKDKAVGLIECLCRGGAELMIIRLFKNQVISKIFLLENKIEYDIDEKILANTRPLLTTRIAKNHFFKFFLLPYYAFKLSQVTAPGATVVSITHKSDIINIISKLFFKHKSVVTIVVAPAQSYRGLRIVLLAFIRFLYIWFADIVVVNSYGIENFCVEKLGIPRSKLVTIYNPIAVDEVRTKSLESLNDMERSMFSNGQVFITLARLSWQKGQWHLLRIFKEVRKNLPTAKLVIIGDGELRDYLTKLSVELNFKTFVGWRGDIMNESYDVYFLGSQENPYKFVARSSLFLFTSLFEGGAYAVSETLICGTPVMSADCRFGPREILSPQSNLEYETKQAEFAEYGILMPTLDKKQRLAKDPLSAEGVTWAKTIVEFCQNKDILEKYRNVGLDRVKDFDLSKIIPIWQDLIK